MIHAAWVGLRRAFIVIASIVTATGAIAQPMHAQSRGIGRVGLTQPLPLRSLVTDSAQASPHSPALGGFGIGFAVGVLSTLAFGRGLPLEERIEFGVVVGLIGALIAAVGHR
jgi:hypothetical protein